MSRLTQMQLGLGHRHGHSGVTTGGGHVPPLYDTHAPPPPFEICGSAEK